MTREQIEAWLALEGWNFHPKEGSRCNHMWRNTGDLVELVTLHDGLTPMYYSGPYCKIGRNSEIDKATDEQLQLIYQEIIKHDT